MNSNKRKSHEDKSYDEYKAFEYSKELLHEINEAFDFLDKDKKNYLERGDLKVLMLILGFNPNEYEIDRLCSQWDIKDDSKIELENLYEILKVKFKLRDNNQLIRSQFESISDKDLGNITESSLYNNALLLNIKVSEEEIKELIDTADIDKDGIINENEFMHIISKTNVFN